MGKLQKYTYWFLIIIWGSLSLSAHGQYFGRNKPGYKKFNYKVYETPHFEIYHYFKDDSTKEEFAQLCEKWYTIHQKTFQDTFKTPNPIMIYADHPDFQQTNSVMGSIGVGTGGVTEALRNRVVMPYMETYGQTNHVLGHEMVHAFQFHTLFEVDSASLNALRELPLWMVEGMAEYLSLGSTSSHTAMWMRDALLHNKFPTLYDMTVNMNYFPYRYGHAFWSYVGKTYGDSLIVPIFRMTASHGYETALEYYLDISPEAFSNKWKDAMDDYYGPFIGDSIDDTPGKLLFFKDNVMEMNLSPSLSPDGSKIAFFSEKNVFTLDLFLADTKTGDIQTTLFSSVRDSDVDAISFVGVTPSWSPDAKRIVVVVVQKGKNTLQIINAETGEQMENIAIKGVPSIHNPVWSPVSNEIAFAGLVNGQVDLYIYDLDTEKLRQLTKDRFSYFMPAWSPDGKVLIYSTDKMAKGERSWNTYSLEKLSLESGEFTPYDLFLGAVNMNPVYAGDGKSFFFISDRNGARNLYRYYPDEEKLVQLSDLITGVSGITQYSPALSVARDNNQVSYSYYDDNHYKIYLAKESDFKPVEVASDSLNFAAAVLPPVEAKKPTFVDQNLASQEKMYTKDSSYINKKYVPRFQLDYISNTGAGVVYSRFGTGVAGGVVALFSDISGDNQLFSSVSLNGEIYDFGAQAAYLRNKGRFKLGGSLSHIPYRYATYGFRPDSSFDQQGFAQDYNIYRIFQSGGSLFSYYPFSTTQRLEWGVSAYRYGFRLDRITSYYDRNGYLHTQQREKNIDTNPGFMVYKLDMGFVSDNSHFGLTSPLRGHRSRFSVEKFYGEYDYYGILADYRRYFYFKPFNFSFRLYHYGRYFYNTLNQFVYELYAGDMYYMRGYQFDNVYGNSTKDAFALNQLQGHRLLLTNMEFRLPFTGPKKLALIKSRVFFTQLSAFLDGGLAWSEGDNINFRWTPTASSGQVPVFSTGVSLRINLFGYLVLEPYYAFPLQLEHLRSKGTFGLSFFPGW